MVGCLQCRNIMTEGLGGANVLSLLWPEIEQGTVPKRDWYLHEPLRQPRWVFHTFSGSSQARQVCTIKLNHPHMPWVISGARAREHLSNANSLLQGLVMSAILSAQLSFSTAVFCRHCKIGLFACFYHTF